MTIDETLKVVNYLKDCDNDDILEHLIRIESLLVDLVHEMRMLNGTHDKETDDDLPF